MRIASLVVLMWVLLGEQAMADEKTLSAHDFSFISID
ncbi:uncharacterized protein METZ01_LOCUS346622, partial [marine metagenome]